MKWREMTKMSKPPSCEKWYVALPKVYAHRCSCHMRVTRRCSAFTSCAQGMPLSFDTSHNKKVEGNYTGLVKRDTKRSARQYMNRIGLCSIYCLPSFTSPLAAPQTCDFRWF